MFIQIANDILDALINLKHASSITARPYESGYQLVADFRRIGNLLIALQMSTGKVVILTLIVGPSEESKQVGDEKQEEERAAYSAPTILDSVVRSR